MAPIRFWLLLALQVVSSWAMAAPVGTAFTYQGELKVLGVVATGAYDFEFALFSVVSDGSAIATVTRGDVPVTNGLFTLELDYTDVPFTAAQDYYLEVRVRDGASVGGYTQLLPRQKLTPVPYAVNARSVQAGGVGAEAIAANAVGNSQITTQAVTGDKIANGTITANKLAFTAGDVTAVSAGTGLLGGGSSGDLSLALDPAAVQTRVSGECETGKYVRGIAQDGTVLCESVLVYLAIKLVNVVDDPVNQVGDNTDVAIGADDFPVISYRDTTANALKVAKCANAGCTGVTTITTVDDPPSGNNVGYGTSIAVPADGLPVISYHDSTAGALKVAKCANPACSDTANDTVTTVDDPVNGNVVGFYTAIAIGGDGLPVISYWNGTASDLKVLKCSNAACSDTVNNVITTVDSSANAVGLISSIGVPSDGRPVIAYYDATAGTLKVIRCANASCSDLANNVTTKVDDPANNVGDYASLAIGDDDLPVISYCDDTTGYLKVVHCSFAACSDLANNVITIVGSAANPSCQFDSIAIGNDGRPVISFYEFNGQSLRVAKCANATCTGTATFTTVDDPANQVGWYSAIAVGSDGLPVISYQDVVNRTLKVAKCGNESCQ